MSYKRIMTLVFVYFSLLVAGCGPMGQTQPLPDVNQTTREKAVEGNNAFALALHKQLKTTAGNLFYSPYSITSALSMTYAGARGDTAQEMRDVLHYQLPDAQLHPANAWLMIDLNNRGLKGDYKLHVANRIWGQEGASFLAPFTELLKEQYQAEMGRLDFAGKTEESRQTINKWVEDKTEQRIKDLLPQGSIDASTRLVLTNAIYFKANWATQFEKKNTASRKFHTSKDKSIDVQMMKVSASAQYGEDSDVQLLSLPYKGKELSMVILLPKEIDGVGNIEDKLTTTQLATWIKLLQARDEVDISLPKFEMTQPLDLKPHLMAMGMKKAFQGDADFSGMSQMGLYISAVLHKAFVKVDEEGTEAAAATAVVMRETSAANNPSFIVDRPFLFLLRDNTTGAILFVGRIVEPKAS